MHRLAAASFVALVLFAAGCVVEDDVVDTTSQESHSWGNYHWARTSNPFTLSVGDNVSSEWDSVLNTSISDWTQSTVLNLNKVAGGAANRRCKGAAGRVEVCNRKYGNNGWLGVATISVQGSHITAGNVKLNDTYFSTPTYNTTAWRNLVSCQEIGHTLGLDHQDEDFNNPPLGTCMDYTSDPTPNQHPDSHDFQELQSIYAHTDSTTTVGAAVPQQAGDSVEDWGELVGESRGGWQQTYRRELGGGKAVVTHVIWAE